MEIQISPIRAKYEKNLNVSSSQSPLLNMHKAKVERKLTIDWSWNTDKQRSVFTCSFQLRSRYLSIISATSSSSQPPNHFGFPTDDSTVNIHIRGERYCLHRWIWISTVGFLLLNRLPINRSSKQVFTNRLSLWKLKDLLPERVLRSALKVPWP